MGVSEELAGLLAAKFTALFPHLDERQRRLAMGAEARSLGYGGIRLVARAAGVREGTVSRGVAELEAGGEPLDRARRPGGGRKRAAERDPGLVPALLALVEPEERGDPQSPLRWTTKSTRKLAAELTAQGHPVSADTVGDLLREQDFSLQANAKTIEGEQHPDRDAQFRYIGAQASEHMAAGQPVISVDAKKKEQVGDHASAGREWRPKGDPVRVRDHDFPDQQEGTAIPYGIYDLAANTGWVNVGTDHNTAAFAVESVRRWWQAAGAARYPDAARLLITADAGGANGYRTRAWKTGLAALAAETGLDITVCHFPPGTSKWNKIEHRLFSRISMNWRGRPLTSHEVIVATIAATTTATGLRVRAELDTGLYPVGVEVSDQEMAALPLAPHAFHGDWNYTLHPQAPAGPAAPPAPSPSPHIPAAPPPAGPPRCDQATLAHPAITGITPAGLAALAEALTIPWQARREQHLWIKRGRARRRAGHPGQRKLDITDHLLAAFLHDRLALTYYAIAPLLGAHYTTIGHAVTIGRDLLTRHGTTIRPAARLRTLAAFCDYAAAAGITIPAPIKPAC
jgi:transposase